MAINFNNPALANTYSAMLVDHRDMNNALATMNFTGATATPTGTISWSTSNNRFERWNGSAWAAAMPDASTTVRGPVLLDNTVASTSIVLAATANAVKTAYDAAVLASSATVAGRVELATDAETQAGTDAVRAVTPASLRACTATATRIGVVELATDAEVQTGTDTARAVTPAGMRACTATETRIGVIELATNAEAIAGADTARAVTPAGLSAAIRPTTVAGHVRAGNMQIYDGSTGYPSGFDFVSLHSSVTESVWTTIGPTGSGATVIWTALDNLPSNARILMVKFWAELSPGSDSGSFDLVAYAAAGGVTPNFGLITSAFYLGLVNLENAERIQTVRQQFIPLNSSRVFQVFWTSDASDAELTMYYQGFMTD